MQSSSAWVLGSLSLAKEKTESTDCQIPYMERTSSVKTGRNPTCHQSRKTCPNEPGSSRGRFENIEPAFLRFEFLRREPPFVLPSFPPSSVDFLLMYSSMSFGMFTWRSIAATEICCRKCPTITARRKQIDDQHRIQKACDGGTS